MHNFAKGPGQAEEHDLQRVQDLDDDQPQDEQENANTKVSKKSESEGLNNHRVCQNTRTC